jgi:hypothetical protein
MVWNLEGRIPKVKSKSRPSRNEKDNKESREEEFAKMVSQWTEDNARVDDLPHEEAGERIAAITRVSLDAAKEVIDQS